MRSLTSATACTHAGLNEVRPRRPEQYGSPASRPVEALVVSMKSGLEGRNNNYELAIKTDFGLVSMKSGLEGRNNITLQTLCRTLVRLSQ